MFLTVAAFVIGTLLILRCIEYKTLWGGAVIILLDPIVAPRRVVRDQNGWAWRLADDIRQEER